MKLEIIINIIKSEEEVKIVNYNSLLMYALSPNISFKKRILGEH